MAVSGRYAYAADVHIGLQVLDISNPAAPVRVGGYGASGGAHGIAVSGGYAYMAARTALVILRIPQGDIDGDGHVDVVDLLHLVDAFGSAAGDANYDTKCDFNNDGAVDVLDLLDLVGSFGM